MDENIPPPYKHTECKSCKETNKSLFARQPLRDNKDFFCQKCIDEGKHAD